MLMHFLFSVLHFTHLNFTATWANGYYLYDWFTIKERESRKIKYLAPFLKTEFKF